MTKCPHLLIMFTLWGLGSVAQPATALGVATDSRTVAESLDDNTVTSPILIAAPQNLNPGLHEPPPALPIIPEADPSANPSDDLSEPAALEAITPQVHVPFIEWESLEIDVSDSLSNFGQGNRILTPIFRGQLANGDAISLSPGFNQFEMPTIESVTHIPLTVAWEGDINDVSLAIEGGLDIYNRLPLDTHFDAQVSVPLGNAATLSMAVEQGPYLFNAQTLENGISTWRYGPNIFWQIDPKTTLFSLVRLGHFNDGNFEQQSFSRLERTFWGEAAIAANLFNWSFQQDLETTSGYFSPPDFLVASLEVSWEKEIIEDVSCRVAANLGQQRLNGSWATGYGHQALCAFDFIPGLPFDFGYNYSNVGNGQTFLSDESAYNNFEWVGGVTIQF
ncbi:MAG: hypothetical protein AAFY54_06390 [Cyanobacteria bacterium J06648_10]